MQMYIYNIPVNAAATKRRVATAADNPVVVAVLPWLSCGRLERCRFTEGCRCASECGSKPCCVDAKYDG